MKTQMLSNPSEMDVGQTTSFDVIGLEDLARLLGVSSRTIWNYRLISCRIPDYELVCDRWWEYRHGESYISVRGKFINQRLKPPAFDKPPFCRGQAEILSSVHGMFKAGLTQAQIRSKIAKNPTIWRKYHV